MGENCASTTSDMGVNELNTSEGYQGEPTRKHSGDEFRYEAVVYLTSSEVTKKNNSKIHKRQNDSSLCHSLTHFFSFTDETLPSNDVDTIGETSNCSNTVNKFTKINIFDSIDQWRTKRFRTIVQVAILILKKYKSNGICMEIEQQHIVLKFVDSKMSNGEH